MSLDIEYEGVQENKDWDGLEGEIRIVLCYQQEPFNKEKPWAIYLNTIGLCSKKFYPTDYQKEFEKKEDAIKFILQKSEKIMEEFWDVPGVEKKIDDFISAFEKVSENGFTRKQCLASKKIISCEDPLFGVDLDGEK